MNNHANIPDLTGKTAIVTGSNSGTGYGIAFHLASHGCKVIMASRNEAKLVDARERLLKEAPGADLEIEILDLTSLDSIKLFAERIRANHTKIDFLANNAGGGSMNFTKTVDGYEATFFLNYLGHFAVTTHLLPVLSDGSRIVNFTSLGYKRFLKRDLDVNNLQITTAEAYNQMQEYCMGKLCSILHAVKLNREFERLGLTSKALVCHPGFARTNLLNNEEFPSWMVLFARYIFTPLSILFRRSHDLYHGALPAIEALIADEVKPEMVYAPGNRHELTGDPIPWEIDRTHFKEADIDLLWDKSQELLNLNISDYLKVQVAS